MEYKETNVIHHDKSFCTKAIEITIIALVVLIPLAFYFPALDIYSYSWQSWLVWQ